MKLNARRIKIYYSIGLIILLFSVCANVFGQTCKDCTCVDCGSGEKTCATADDGSISRCECTFRNNNEAAQLIANNESQFDADYYNQQTGEKISAEALAKDEKRQRELKAGKITREDGTTITFTPIGKVKQSIREKQEIDRMPLQNRFNEIWRRDGLDKAIEEYQKLINNPLIDKLPFSFFENLGTDLIKRNNLTDAIKVSKFVLELNPNLEVARNNLAEAYSLSGDKNRAIRNYERVLQINPANRIAIDRLNTIRTTQKEQE